MSTLGDFGADVPDDEPWKDRNTLRGLYHGDDLTQGEIAEHFNGQGHDVAPSTISYWMNKLEIETTHSDYSSDSTNEDQDFHEEPCVHCGDDVPANNLICNDCLDEVRHNDN